MLPVRIGAPNGTPTAASAVTGEVIRPPRSSRPAPGSVAVSSARI
jgi:hypothetical protein